MRKVLNIFFFTLLITLSAACNDDNCRLENKWQLREYVHTNGIVQREDSVFYNFMDGSFSAICVLPDGKFETYFGNYVYQGDDISITLLPEYTSKIAYNRYLGWDNGSRKFQVEKLSSTALQLNYNGEKSIFRKY
ncbi:lipocalin-like domain-containing protein [Bacteroides sedimenti]|uniref:Lipocalin-like domain-containing protein n=1 Tax=Bacteroides sedimenti TaxID=2136147 RepID=A0ABN6Z1A2_9BACE